MKIGILSGPTDLVFLRYLIAAEISWCEISEIDTVFSEFLSLFE